MTGYGTTDDVAVLRRVVVEVGWCLKRLPFAFLARSRLLGRLALACTAEAAGWRAAVDVLARLRPSDGVWGPGLAAPAAGRVWLIDPLDGASSYVRRDGREWHARRRCGRTGT
jgi:hypothetical protein